MTAFHLLLVIALCTLATASQSKTIDLRNKTDADGSLREISFCARPSPGAAGLPAHAFVSFATTSKAGVITFRSLGHTVFGIADALLSYNGLIPATGALVDERYTAIKQVCLTIQVNQAEYDSAYLLASQPLAAIGIAFDETKPIQKSYSLAVEDCVSFVTSIATRFSAVGVKVPKRKANELPLPYVRRLVDSN